MNKRFTIKKISGLFILSLTSAMVFSTFCNTQASASSDSSAELTQIAAETLSSVISKTSKNQKTISATFTCFSYNNDASSVNMSWNPVDGACGYEITAVQGSDTKVYESLQPSYTMSGLSAGSVYSIKLRCYATENGVKTYSNYSDIYTVTSGVNKVTGLKMSDRSADSDSSNLTFTWDSQGEACYAIYYRISNTADYILAGTNTTNSYTISGLTPSVSYDVAVKAYSISEFICSGDLSDAVTQYTTPLAVADFTVTKATTSELDISWSPNPSASYFNIYRSINDGGYTFYKSVTSTTLTETPLTPGTVYSYKIAAYAESTSIEGPLTSELRGVTLPLTPSGLKINGSETTSISISWNPQDNTSGFLIYRIDSTLSSYEFITSTTDTSYKDTTVTSGKTYKYKICAYADTVDHYGEFTSMVKTSTLPATPVTSTKAGNTKLRLKWSAITGASGYYIYEQDDAGNYVLSTTLTGKSSTTAVFDSLNNDITYSYKIISYRNACDTTFISPTGQAVSVTPTVDITTTKKAYTYTTKKSLKNSTAWNISSIKKSANYSKCYIIPGLSQTNVNDLPSSNMCPQGMCIAGKYMLISAYDRDGDENSVIYVLSKSSRKLLTVIVLEDQTHAGGLCYDGSNIWVTNGKKLCSLSFSDIRTAANNKKTFMCLSYTNMCTTEGKASFVTYHKGKLWSGDYEATTTGTLRSYAIQKTTTASGTSITLKCKTSMQIPSSVQGLAFRANGNLLLSRAYSTTHQIDIYKPKVSSSDSSITYIRKRLKVIPMPSLCENICISGSYLYVNFESAVSPAAQNHMDRVLGLKLSKL